MISPADVHGAASRLERENLRFRTLLKNRADEKLENFVLLTLMPSIPVIPWDTE